MLFKHEAYEDLIVSFALVDGITPQQIQNEEYNQTKVLSDAKDPFMFSIVCKKKDKEGSKQFNFKTETESERDNWVQHINKFTKNIDLTKNNE